jgi:multidrug resistance protein MdtO
MAAALRCYHLTALLQPGDDHPDARRRIARSLTRWRIICPRRRIQPLIVPRDGANSAILQEIAEVLARLARGETIPLPQGEVEKAPLLLPDAWSNPAYLHFALKTLLATLLCYVFYTAADWQGIHTIMLSCVIVAQPGWAPPCRKRGYASAARCWPR